MLPTTYAGLSSVQAASHLAIHGRNELPAMPPRGLAQLTLAVLAEPMFLLLILAAVLYLILGDLAEGLLLGLFAVLTVSLVIVGERRSEAAINALKAMATRYANVVRDGIALRVDSAMVVPGDALLLNEGERVAADAVLLQGYSVVCDESLLTGESAPVHKFAASQVDTLDGPAFAETAPTALVFSGCMVSSGHGLARVVATGANAQIGLIGSSLALINTEPTRLQRNSQKLVRIFGFNALLMSVGLVIFYGTVRGAWLEGALSAIALAMAMLPEEFPLVLGIFFAVGAWRLAKLKVLVRRSAVIETLGAVTVLCVDKTGTLTHNKMRLAALRTQDESFVLQGDERALPESVHRLLEYAQLASKPHSLDPMDLAIHQVATKVLNNTEHWHSDWPLQQEYPLTAGMFAMSYAWKKQETAFAIACKGAPEAVADLCHLPTPMAQWLQIQVNEMATAGLRVLAVAEGQFQGQQLPTDQHAFEFKLLGLLGFADPLRPSVPAAVAAAHQAGISVKMITGDYPQTASAIAAQAGIRNATDVLTGDQLLLMDDATLAPAVAQVNVYARINPAQKLRLVRALKAAGEVVAMTGDGVNDAPALKAAHVGIAMGKSGTDVAREAADIVLLDEDFARIVTAVRMGRRIYDNLRKVMLYIIAIHVPIAGLALLPLLMGLPPMLLPVHVVMIEMIIDPMCAFAFESEPDEAGNMQVPPRPLNELLVGPAQFGLGLAQGLIVLLTCLLLYRFEIQHGSNTALARTLAFICFTASNLAMVKSLASRTFSYRSWRLPWRTTYWCIGGLATMVIASCIAIPNLRALFGFALPTYAQTISALLIGLAAGAILEWFKWLPWVHRTLGGTVVHSTS
jgi:P-type Ca2+ transporter type 2C